MKRLFKYLRPYWYIAIFSPLFMIAEVAVDLSLPNILADIVNESIYASSVSEGLSVVASYGVKMLLLVIAGGVTGLGAAGFASAAAQSFGDDLRRDTFAHVMALSPEQTDKFTVGSLVTRMTNDVTMMQNFIAAALRMFFRSPIMFVGGILMAISLNSKFALVIAISLPLQLAIVFFIMKKIRPMFETVQERLDDVNAVMQENVTGARVVKAYVREDHEIRRFGKVNEDLFSVMLRVQTILAWMTPLMMIVMNGAVVAVILLGGVEVSRGAIEVGDVMAVIQYILLILRSVMMISMMFSFISRAEASAKRVCEVLDASPVVRGGTYTGCDTEEKGEGENEGENEEKKGHIVFDNVSFSYPDAIGTPVLHDISLDIRAGENVAILGATGVGKTTLVSLIPRFYDPTEGEILLDGVPVREYSLEALRNKVAFVLQKSELFSGTIADNLRWGDETADDEALRDAAEIAQANEFIEGFSAGYDTVIAEKGASLSGGQKQRLAIARALIKKPEVLIFDDSFSALDLATGAKLQKALRERAGNTTVITIAQRVASVMGADRILVLDGGTVAAEGTHEELLRNSPIYRDIYDSQVKRGGDIE